MYDPVLGRFISVDPIMDLADPQQWNAYSYANNTPVTMSDPTGLKAYAHDGSSGYTPPVQEALPKDRSVRSGRGVARRAPTAGQPGTYRPPPVPSTSYRGGYSSGGSLNGSSGGGVKTDKGTGLSATREKFKKEPLNLESLGTIGTEEQKAWHRAQLRGSEEGAKAQKEWFYENRHELANGAVFVVGASAAVVCVVGTLGWCAIAGAAAIGAGYSNNRWQGMSGEQASALAVFQAVTLAWGVGIGGGLASSGASTLTRRLTGVLTGIPGGVCLGTVAPNGATRC